MIDMTLEQALINTHHLEHKLNKLWLVVSYVCPRDGEITS